MSESFDFFSLAGEEVLFAWQGRLKYVESLLWYEGDLVAHLRLDDQDFVLVWVDVNPTHHRWLMLQATPEQVVRVRQDIQGAEPTNATLRELLNTQPRNLCLFVDTIAPNNYTGARLVERSSIPDTVL